MSGTRASNDRPPGAGGVKRGRLQQEVAATGSRVTVVLGAQWGDEGKGKVVDLLATDADIVSRCQVRARRRVPPQPAQRASPLPWDPDEPCPSVSRVGHGLLDSSPPGAPSPSPMPKPFLPPPPHPLTQSSCPPTHPSPPQGDGRSPS